ncbi:hypothetical protein [Microbacterium invictum]|uniref:Uncharacterized protein n=1 Tax=Microbacterium invictum TaxID=515415 RepID=A0AA40SQE9_9MICO|nr:MULTISPECIES: hypothetical protein [Microbacterium]MBB4140411.1 hypothetical protein [Microbacterium invictum]
MPENRSERRVLEELSDDERALLTRALEIERSKLHIPGYDATEELLAAVKVILP